MDSHVDSRDVTSPHLRDPRNMGYLTDSCFGVRVGEGYSQVSPASHISGCDSLSPFLIVGDTGAPAGFRAQDSQSRLQSRLQHWLRVQKAGHTSWQLRSHWACEPRSPTSPYDLVILLPGPHSTKIKSTCTPTLHTNGPNSTVHNS